MLEIVINGKKVEVDDRATILEAALKSGVEVPHLCWHPKLSGVASCRVCLVRVEGWSKLTTSCNTRVFAGMVVDTVGEQVQKARQTSFRLLTLNHPADCGICDKSGECLLQDYHHEFNATPSLTGEEKRHSEKFHDLSERILLDDERCVLCSRCVRFTHEISKSKALGVFNRADHSVVRRMPDVEFKDDYSDNIIDLCPVGALLSKDFLYKARVWQLKKTTSVCPGCSRGCNINIETKKNEVLRVTPNTDPWICNKGRDLRFKEERSLYSLQKGKQIQASVAKAEFINLINSAKKIAFVVSSWASNEELESFQQHLSGRGEVFTKVDRLPVVNETLQDDVLLRSDKNPNAYAVKSLFGEKTFVDNGEFDLLMVWGEGFDFASKKPNLKTIYLNSYRDHYLDLVDLHLPISTMVERAGSFTNFEGKKNSFEQVFGSSCDVFHVENLFKSFGGEK